MTPQEEINQALAVQIKNLRKQIDGTSLAIIQFDDVFIDDFRMSSGSLLLAKAWLGKLLGELGIPTPYANDGNRKTVADIEPTADTPTEEDIQLLFKDDGKKHSAVEWIDTFRQIIQHQINFVQGIQTQGTSREYAIARTNAYNYLCEARFFLGFALEAIRNESLNQTTGS